MDKQTFKIKAKFVFNGQAIVKARSRAEAEAKVKDGLVAILDRVVKYDEDIVEWSTSSRSHAVINRKQEDKQ